MRLLLIGAPGSGKGTQAERLAERFNITHISSGDLLRQHVRDQTSIGETIKAYVDAGDLVPDSVVLDMLRKPVVAAVNGYALGGGLELALGCDIRLAAEPATFAAPEIKLGWIGGGGMSALLAHSIGPGNAAVMLLTGDPIDAATALRWGLVTEVLPAEDLAARAAELAATIASRAPIAAQTAKRNLRAAFEMPLGRAIDYERQLQTVCFATEDAAEGRAAFAERRPPVFRAR